MRGLLMKLQALEEMSRYFKNSLRAGNYFPFDDDHKWVISNKGSAGVMTGMGKVTRVADRFELGGESLRGFADSGIGPRDKRTKDALGGLYYYKATVELICSPWVCRKNWEFQEVFSQILEVFGIREIKQRKGIPILSNGTISSTRYWCRRYLAFPFWSYWR